MPRLRSTHTNVAMEISAASFAEIRQRFLEAEWNQAILVGRDGVETLDMTGIELVQDERLPTRLRRDTYVGPG